MKFKLDENLDWRLAELVAEGAHDADTVRSEQLSGSSDQVIYETCVREGRVLITLDLDFANPIRFPPSPTPGIIVVRPVRPVMSQITTILAAGLVELKRRLLTGKLWIVEPGRIRLYDPSETGTERD